MLACCGRNVSLWDIEPYMLVDTFQKESEDDWEYTDLSWSCDHKCLAVLRPFGPVEILRVQNGKFNCSEELICFPVEEDSYPTSISFMSNSNRYLAIGSRNGKVAIWDCKANNVRKTFVSGGIEGEVDFVDFNAIGSHIAAAMSSGGVLVHEYLSATKKIYRVPQSTRVTSMRYQKIPQTSVMGAGSAEGHVTFWNTITGAEVSAIVGAHRKAVTDVAFSPVNSKLAATVSRDKRLCFHDIVARKSALTTETTESLTSIDLYDDGVMAVAGTESGCLLTYDLRCLSYPMASIEIQTGPVKRLRYATKIQTVGRSPGLTPGSNQTGGSVAWSLGGAGVLASTPLRRTFEAPPAQDPPPAYGPYGIFSPLRNDSYQSSNYDSSFADATPGDVSTRSYRGYRSDSTFLKTETSETPENAPHVSAQNCNVPPLVSVLKSTKSESSFGNANSASGESNAIDHSAGGSQTNSPRSGAICDVSAVRTPVVVRSALAAANKSVDDLLSYGATGYGIFSPLNSDSIIEMSDSSLNETSTPLDDAALSHFPFADPSTNAEISPIVEVAAMQAGVPSSPRSRRNSAPSPSALEANIDPEGSLPSETDSDDQDLPTEWNSAFSMYSGEFDVVSRAEGENMAGGDTSASRHLATPEGSPHLDSSTNQSQVPVTTIANQILDQLRLLEEQMSSGFNQINEKLKLLDARMSSPRTD